MGSIEDVAGDRVSGTNLREMGVYLPAIDENRKLRSENREAASLLVVKINMLTAWGRSTTTSTFSRSRGS